MAEKGEGQRGESSAMCPRQSIALQGVVVPSSLDPQGKTGNKLGRREADQAMPGLTGGHRG